MQIKLLCHVVVGLEVPPVMEHPVLQAQVPVLGVKGILPYQTLCHACTYYAARLFILHRVVKIFLYLHIFPSFFFFWTSRLNHQY